MNNWYKFYLEIKYRFFLLLLNLIFIIFISFFYKEILLYCFFYFNTVENLFNFQCNFIFTNVTEIFSTYILLIIFISKQIFFFNFFYHVLIFLSFGLYKNEYVYCKFFFKIILFNWIFFFFFLIKLFFLLVVNFF